ncbi:SWIM zinc finger family protein [Candidatus Woesearchaeota archaeon]|nr:SWIM zinc finger family protein [Candidatus Woesearchaeota archaeon]
MEQEQVEVRKERGREIAKNSRITQKGNKWIVPSQTGTGAYTVVSNGFEATCTCPDYETRRCKCKHVWAVELTVTKEVDAQGNVTITKTVRKTYSQDWHNYNVAQEQTPSFLSRRTASRMVMVCCGRKCITTSNCTTKSSCSTTTSEAMWKAPYL